MKMENENIYMQLKELAMKVCCSPNMEGREKLKRFLNVAHEYTGIRMNWNFMTYDEKEENDRHRTLIHNEALKLIKDFVLYELDREEVSEDFVREFYKLDRKTLGDYANLLVSEFAVNMR